MCLWDNCEFVWVCALLSMILFDISASVRTGKRINEARGGSSFSLWSCIAGGTTQTWTFNMGVCLCVQDKNSFPTNVQYMLPVLWGFLSVALIYAIKLIGLACKRLFPKGWALWNVFTMLQKWIKIATNIQTCSIYFFYYKKEFFFLSKSLKVMWKKLHKT